METTMEFHRGNTVPATGSQDQSRAGVAALAGGARVKVEMKDIECVGPGTLNGRYMRRFWHPVFHATDIAPGQIKPLRILGEDFVLFRAKDGTPQVMAPRCPHRGMSLVAGWVENDTVRCFYHGWRFGKDGQCVEQPAEKNSFCQNIKIASYPTREYIGLIFAYFGEGEPPEFPRYPSFETPGVTLHTDSYTRACGFFNNMENAGDTSHVAFAHRDASVAWDEVEEGRKIAAVETQWGIQTSAEQPDGFLGVGHIGMPNIYHVQGVPDDPEVPHREFIGFWVPHDDDRHTQFTVVRNSLDPDVKERYYKRRNDMLAGQDLDREKTARAILAGEMRIEDVDPSRTNLIFLQDDVAQMGVGPISKRGKENLGRGDAVVVVLRRIWLRELGKFANGEAIKDWRHDPSLEVASAYKRRF